MLFVDNNSILPLCSVQDTEFMLGDKAPSEYFNDAASLLGGIILQMRALQEKEGPDVTVWYLNMLYQNNRNRLFILLGRFYSHYQTRLFILNIICVEEMTAFHLHVLIFIHPSHQPISSYLNQSARNHNCQLITYHTDWRIWCKNAFPFLSCGCKSNFTGFIDFLLVFFTLNSDSYDSSI